MGKEGQGRAGRGRGQAGRARGSPSTDCYSLTHVPYVTCLSGVRPSRSQHWNLCEVRPQGPNCATGELSDERSKAGGPSPGVDTGIASFTALLLYYILASETGLRREYQGVPGKALVSLIQTLSPISTPHTCSPLILLPESRWDGWCHSSRLASVRGRCRILQRLWG